MSDEPHTRIFSLSTQRVALLIVWAALSCLASRLSAQTVRFATFNAALNKSNAGDLIKTLSTAEDRQARAIAEIIQRTRPDVILLNEFDFDRDGVAAGLFQKNYLSVGQNGAEPIELAHVFNAPANTGVPSGLDLNNDGRVGGPDDAFGFGSHPGQYGMLLLSKFPIIENGSRTFQNFLWKDMPRALLPDDPTTADPADWYSGEKLAAVRLSSKSHWDVAIDVNGRIVHVLTAHPTPPVFDGREDRNGRRNHDEIRLWADYIDPMASQYITDDRGAKGGLEGGAKFVILGDYNADPLDGDSTARAIRQLLDHPLVNVSVTPASQGAADAASRQGGSNRSHAGDPAFDTGDFADGASSPGNLRIDYVLPSRNMVMRSAGVFWPSRDDPLFRLVGDFDPNLASPQFPSSDHRLVYADVVVPEPSALAIFVLGICVLSATIYRRGGWGRAEGGLRL